MLPYHGYSSVKDKIWLVGLDDNVLVWFELLKTNFNFSPLFLVSTVINRINHESWVGVNVPVLHFGVFKRPWWVKQHLAVLVPLSDNPDKNQNLCKKILTISSIIMFAIFRTP